MFITATTLSGVFEASVATVLAAVVVHMCTAAIHDASIAGLLNHQSIIIVVVVLLIGDCRGCFLETEMWV